jgi:hypothetical protein
MLEFKRVTLKFKATQNPPGPAGASLFLFEKVFRKCLKVPTYPLIAHLSIDSRGVYSETL